MTLARIPLSSLGLYSWRSWSALEKLYFLQIVPVTLVVFGFSSGAEVKMLASRQHALLLAVPIFLHQMIWGYYQEFLYRGLLQTELVRRLGSLWGILISNLVFTFGPLHAYHFALARGHASHLWIFSGIFAIGLYFGVLYWRSGNLWTVAIPHGLGDFFIGGLSWLARLIR